MALRHHQLEPSCNHYPSKGQAPRDGLLSAKWEGNVGRSLERLLNHSGKESTVAWTTFGQPIEDTRKGGAAKRLNPMIKTTQERYMPEYIFNICTVTAVRAHLSNKMSLAASLTELAYGYRPVFINDGYQADWLLAGNSLLGILAKPHKRFIGDTTDLYLRHMQFFFKYYNLGGSKKWPRFLRGEWIVGELTPPKDRPKRFLLGWSAFHMCTTLGKVPLPPRGWKL